jgi:hypothetical protein
MQLVTPSILFYNSFNFFILNLADSSYSKKNHNYCVIFTVISYALLYTLSMTLNFHFFAKFLNNMSRSNLIKKSQINYKMRQRKYLLSIISPSLCTVFNLVLLFLMDIARVFSCYANNSHIP